VRCAVARERVCGRFVVVVAAEGGGAVLAVDGLCLGGGGLEKLIELLRGV
jgi:hypothetical protein